MALDTYANLKAAIKRHSHRNDIDDVVDDFIDLAEDAMFNNKESVLDSRALETSTTTTTSTRTLALPTGFLRFRKLTLTSGGVEYDCIQETPEAMQVTSSGRPRSFTITDQIEFDRTPDGTYTVNYIYIAKPTALSSSNATNAVLTNHPTIYLYGALWALNLWAHEEEKAAIYWQNFLNAIRGANRASKRQRHGPAASIRFEGSTP